MSVENARENLQKLVALYGTCSPCPFGKTEPNHKVFGEGNPCATLMLIGEAPGAEEDRLKRPFVGRSGKLLEKLFTEAGFSRSDVYITNVVKCRPPDNKTPLPQEISERDKQLLKQEISIVQPRVICTLGAVATRLFLPDLNALSAVRGTEISFPKRNFTLIPTFHPAYILRNGQQEPLLLRDLLTAYTLSKMQT